MYKCIFINYKDVNLIHIKLFLILNNAIESFKKKLIISQSIKDLHTKYYENTKKKLCTFCELVINTKLDIDFVFGFTVYIPQQKAETDSPNLNVAC